MHDYLKDAAKASGLTDGQLIAVVRHIRDRAKLSGFEQAVLDELERRRLKVD